MEQCEQPKFVRYQAVSPTRRDLFPGILALANGLANSDRLNPEDWTAWRRANDRADAANLDPMTVDASVYDRAINPTAQSWFKNTATNLPADQHFY